MMREYNELPTAKSKNLGLIALEVVREPMFVLLLSSSTEVGVTRSVCYEDGGAMPRAFIKRIHLRINNMFKPKTSSEIFKNSVNPDSESSIMSKY
jgi:hypothetical protein